MELIEAYHSMSKPNSPQEKAVKKNVHGSVKKNVHGSLRIIVRLKMPSKFYWSAQMTRQFKQACFIETT